VDLEEKEVMQVQSDQQAKLDHLDHKVKEEHVVLVEQQVNLEKSGHQDQ